MEYSKNMAHFWFDGDCTVSVTMRRRLLEVFGSVEKVYGQSDAAIQKCLSMQFDEQAVLKLLNRRNRNFLDQELGRLKEHHIQILYPEHPLYPQKLKQLYDMPRILFARGTVKESLNHYNQTIAIVGARDADTYSREVTHAFARELAKKGIQIVSGLARGIDSQAHIGCMEADGYTIAVLGCGINVIYPRENVELYMEVEKNGLILSEYGMDVPPNPYQFPIRNRIISGISDGVLVACAKKKSGSLITADLALEQGKQVYALPGRVLDTFSEGTNHLIQMGAMCVMGPKDILYDLQGEKAFYKEKNEDDVEDETLEEHLTSVDMECFNDSEKIVYNLLGLEPIHVDELIQKSKLGVTKTINTLYHLEKIDCIKQVTQGYYIIKL